MTEPILGGDSFSAGPSVAKGKTKPSRATKAILATVVSLFLPGMGQLYVQRVWRGVVIAILGVAINALATEMRLFMTFRGMIAAISLGILWRLWVAADAFYMAWRFDRTVAPRRNPREMIAAVLIVFLLVGYPVPDYFGKRLLSSFRAYKISSGSMCPTICQGERVVVAADAYKMHGPERGDLIVFDFNRSGTIFPKRVIGVAGDTVSSGQGNTILVDDVPLKLPGPCAFRYFGGSFADLPSFKAVKIPEGTLFVVGDNLSNSYDSRFFGPIPLDEVRGKLKFIYWSGNRARIGCELR
jgi:signal peptidase I